MPQTACAIRAEVGALVPAPQMGPKKASRFSHKKGTHTTKATSIPDGKAYDPYATPTSTPQASPASQRPQREPSEKGKPSPESAKQMMPPPRRSDHRAVQTVRRAAWRAAWRAVAQPARRDAPRDGSGFATVAAQAGRRGQAVASPSGGAGAPAAAHAPTPSRATSEAGSVASGSGLVGSSLRAVVGVARRHGHRSHQGYLRGSHCTRA